MTKALPDNALECPQSASSYCAWASEGCPVSIAATCAWELRNGASGFGGVSCGVPGVDGGAFADGVDVRVDGGERLYLSDEVGVTAILEIPDHGVMKCIAGPPVFKATTCEFDDIAFACRPLDAGAD